MSQEMLVTKHNLQDCHDIFIYFKASPYFAVPFLCAIKPSEHLCFMVFSPKAKDSR